MQAYICQTCGVQYSPSNLPPDQCFICEDERQYVPAEGQKWTTLKKMQQGKFQNNWELEEDNLYSIRTVPKFAIGQTAYLLQDEEINILWDCLTYLDEQTKEAIAESGGIDAIVLSHPHYYSSQVEWAEAFDAVIYIHEDDRKWVTRRSKAIEFWSGEVLELSNTVSIHRLGGHFEGGAVLNWTKGSQGKGVLLTGDIIQVVADPGWVSFMYSYPNLIPLPASKVSRIAEKSEKLSFDRLYNAFHGIIDNGAYDSVQRSAQRYIDALEDRLNS